MNTSVKLRPIEILKAAVLNGFEIEESTSFESLVIEAEEFLLESDCADQIFEESPIIMNGTQQDVSFNDGFGYEFISFGEIISAHQYSKLDESKYVHSRFLNSLGQVVNLYTNAELQKK